MAEHAAPMTLRLLTPGGCAAETECDSVRLPLRDGADGTGGGLVGIQRDHAPAVMALGRGEIRALRDGRIVLRAGVEDGFASVRDNVITILTDSAVLPETATEE